MRLSDYTQADAERIERQWERAMDKLPGGPDYEVTDEDYEDDLEYGCE